MPIVRFSEEAENDLCDIAEYIARDKPQAARNWLANIREACELLAHNPEIGETRRHFGVVGCRSFGVGHYVIFFRQTADGIDVARVVHGSRDLRNL